MSGANRAARIPPPTLLSVSLIAASLDPSRLMPDAVVVGRQGRECDYAPLAALGHPRVWTCCFKEKTSTAQPEYSQDCQIPVTGGAYRVGPSIIRPGVTPVPRSDAPGSACLLSPEPRARDAFRDTVTILAVRLEQALQP